ncbi:tripartite tricarboxylate transporter substrate binding protein [Polaromonas sp.]|uniref:tripartite tricarboxylate transporter substrate binding protein n=1 Tax=Polaromonas sp. TaxID=1869339 RepID=UPI0017CDF173|nr:tripartite tricarboxylate transporter substrate binding protein [Polaromonas sp.]NMM05925.1 tripartite tricarboxylate transporter substrate binding protein [Polaromonas sp.]
MYPLLQSRRLSSAFCVPVIVLACAVTTPMRADEKPNATALELIVPFGPGGGADQLARESAKLLIGILAAPVTVTNVPGATGNTGMAKLMAAPNDCTTMAVLTADTFSLLAYLNPGWKMADVIPLAIMMKQPSALFLPANSRFKTWADFEKEARLRPDKLRVAITGFGSPDYLMLQQLAAKGIRLAPVPLANPEERYRAPFDEQADALYEQPGDVQSLIDAKQLRPIIVFNATRLAGFKDVPASSELGFGNGRNQFRAIVVRAGTDPAKVKLMSEALDKVAAMPQYKSFLDKQEATSNSYVPAINAAAFMQGELDVMKKIVEALPFHAHYLIQEGGFERYVEPF